MVSQAYIRWMMARGKTVSVMMPSGGRVLQVLNEHGGWNQKSRVGKVEEIVYLHDYHNNRDPYTGMIITKENGISNFFMRVHVELPKPKADKDSAAESAKIASAREKDDKVLAVIWISLAVIVIGISAISLPR